MIWALFAGKNGGRFGRHSGGKSASRAFAAPDGRTWGAEVRVPGASNAMVVFLDPGGDGAGHRYAWHITSGAEARDVTARLTTQQVLDALTDADLARLFRRSMPISSRVPRLEPAIGQYGAGPELDLSAAADDVEPV